MPEEITKDGNVNSILKELSDIKANLAVNSNETANIKSALTEIKSDMKEIKNDFITRRELSETVALIKEEISPLKKVVYGCVALVLSGFIGVLITLTYK